MLKISEESEGNILILEAESKLTDEDYKQVFIPRLEAIIQEHGQVRLLLDMGDPFQGWKPKAAWDDAYFGLTHRKDFEKIAVIADRRWVEWAFRLSAPLFPGEKKVFSPSERAEAHRWIKS